MAVSWSTFAGVLLALYAGTTVWTLSSLWLPRTCAPSPADRDCVAPLLEGEQPTVDVWIFASKSKQDSLSTLRKSRESLILRREGLRLGESLSEDVALPVAHHGTRKRGGLTAHIFMWNPEDRRATKEEDEALAATEGANSTLRTPSGKPLGSFQTYLTKKMPVSMRERKMLLATSNDTGSDEDLWPEGDIAHLRPHLTIQIMGPKQPGFPRMELPSEIRWALLQDANRLKYRPIVRVDDLSLVEREFLPLSTNSSRSDPVIPIHIQPTSIGMYRFLSNIASSMKQMEQFGLTEKDLEEIKGLVVGTRWQWLLATFVVGLLHSFFAFLAFKNDVGFWKGRTNMEGLSARSYISNFVCQVIIFLNLLEGGQTSGIILAEIGIGVAIEGWKVSKIAAARGMGRLAYWRGGPAVVANHRSKRDLDTDQYDAHAMKMLGYVLYPVVGLYGGYCLIYHPHRSWLSWLLSTLSSGVYMFGFITMTPQLYINYRLKSVAHLPWRAFMYKAFNTFIDDVFAFAIAMPMMHRLACLRDDLVFFIYLYQRWLYPIDKTRVNEFGRAYEHEFLSRFGLQEEATPGEGQMQEAGNTLMAEPKEATLKKDD